MDKNPMTPEQVLRHLTVAVENYLTSDSDRRRLQELRVMETTAKLARATLASTHPTNPS